MQQETETDRKLRMWLERNGPWLMKLDPAKVMWRVGLELAHGRLIKRSVDESLLVAAGFLRQVYEDGDYQKENSEKIASQEGGQDGKGTARRQRRREAT